MSVKFQKGPFLDWLRSMIYSSLLIGFQMLAIKINSYSVDMDWII